MAIFTAAATALLAGTALAGSTFAVGALTFGLQVGASVALNYAAKALAGNKDEPAAAKADGFSAQGTLQAGGDIPRSFNLGYSMTAGSLVYANTWGNDGETPNAYFTQVISLSDLPGGGIAQVWVNGELCTLDTGSSTEMGYPVLQYRKDGRDHVWVKYYDGTQSTADAFLQTKVSTFERPWLSTRVGLGIAYVICTALVEDTLFTGFPTYKFAVTGIPLYDPSKDSTVGGSGSHRWSDRSTWGGDGDNFPAVQIYNILRGVSYAGNWVYGLQSMTAARLPTVNWISQIAKCRDPIPAAVGGARPTYRSGLQVNLNTQPANLIEVFLTACQGRVSEIGGFYKIHLGAPGSPTFSFTDADILSTEAQNFAPFFPLADSINGITATYPNPAEAWNQKAAPPIYRDDLEARDGGRRLLANPSFDAVWDPEQVQQLMKSALDEAQRARRHAMVMPPAFWLVEPGDIGEWSSVRNGYDGKLFRVDGVVDEPNLDVSWNLTEVDPSDYDWDSSEFNPVFSGPTTFPRPEPQGIVDWFAEPYVIKDNDGLERRPAIRLSWDGDMPGAVGVQYEVRVFDVQLDDYVTVTRGRTDQLAAGALIVSQSLVPKTLYGVRGQYIPSSPRDMLWSDWLAVTTPDVSVSIADFNAALKKQVTDIFNNQIAETNKVVDQLAVIVQQIAARTDINKKEVRNQLFATAGGAKALIEQLSTVVADNELAFAEYQTTVSAQFDTVYSNVTVNSSAIATLEGYAASKYSVTLDVNGYATGFTLINAGGGVSSTTFITTNFQIAALGPGGGAVPIFQTAFVNGVAKIALRADVYADGSITAGKINVAQLSAITANIGDITAGIIRSADNRFVINLGARTLIISD